MSYDIHQGSPQGFLGIGEKSCLIRTWGEGGGITKVGVGGSKKDGEGVVNKWKEIFFNNQAHNIHTTSAIVTK